MITKFFFRVEDSDESEKVQERLFQLGYTWPPLLGESSGKKTPECIDEPILVVDPSAKRITYSSNISFTTKVRQDVEYVEGDKYVLFNTDIYSEIDPDLIEITQINGKAKLSGIISAW